MTNLQIYNEIIQTRGLKELPYQKEFLTTDYTSDKPFVLGAGTSSGKTFMTIMKLEIFYSYSENKNKRTLIIPYSMKVLRDNFSTELDAFKPSFSYCVATTKEELVDYLKSKNVNIDYHDNERGIPIHNDQKHFEYLLLETFQA